MQAVLDRRRLMMTAGATAAILARPPRARAAPVPITIVINQSPWFEGFRRIVERYEQATGAKVELDVNPLGGSIEKQRNAVRGAQSPFDILIINNGFFVEMYNGGFITPLQEIDPSFTLDPAIYTFDDTVYWNPTAKRAQVEGGVLMSVPVNPNIPLLYYRTDLYAEQGLQVPETWDALLANAKALHSPPRRYGIVQRGVRGAFDVTYDFLPYLWGFGADFFKDQKHGDETVVINAPEAKAALDYYIQLAREAGHPKTASQSQADVIQSLVTGKTAHAILVIAAWGQMDDPAKSAVTGKIGFAVPPHLPGLASAPPLGHWLAGIPRNITQDRQRAALDFLRWFQGPAVQQAYAEAGSPPVSRTVLTSDMATQPRYRWMPALARGIELARQDFAMPEAAEVVAITELQLNRAIAGEAGSTEALNRMADDIGAVLARAGRPAGRLPALP